MSALGGTLVAAFTVLPAARAFLSPLFARRQPEDWVRLGEASEIDIGLPIKVDFVQTVKDAWVQQRALHDVWVYTDDGETFTVYNGRCTHLGCGYDYDAARKEFHCPCHHGRFDPRTGAVTGGPPPRGLDTLRTKIERGILYAAYEDFRVGVPAKIPLA